jgi:hypothetical protein
MQQAVMRGIIHIFYDFIKKRIAPADDQVESIPNFLNPSYRADKP